MKRECRCTTAQIQRYRNKISGPLLDRIDIHVEVPSIAYEDLASVGTGDPSSAIRNRIIQAREIQQERYKKQEKVHYNATMRPKDMQKYCFLEEKAQNELKRVITDLNFSARAYDRILKVSRTIADLANEEQILHDHVFEAIQYRTLDRQLW